jgi:hypothetical protein
MEETMFDAGRRPMGRHLYWLLAVVVAFGARVPASGAAPVPQNGAATTTVADTIFMADGTTAQGNLIITWPAFVTASGSAVAGGTANVVLAQTLQINGGTAQDGWTSVKFIEQIELGGALELQHGDVSFNGPCTGVLGGLYAGAVSTPG